MSEGGTRIVSLDQFRGYTVAGMILVNYVGGFAVTHPVFEHHNTYFSYADSIMPAFHFAVGFALRLVLLKRIVTLGKSRAYAGAVRRGLGLILLSTVLEFAGHGAPKSWSAMTQTTLWGALAGPLKNEFWETLAIIGVTSIWVLPVIAGSARRRIIFVSGCLAVHVLLAHLFYFHFLNRQPNWLDRFWGSADVRGLDGGPFGFLAWSLPQIAGSLAYDWVASRRTAATFFRLLLWSLSFMAAGYLLSILSLSYPRTPEPTTSEEVIAVAASPVLPPRSPRNTDRLPALPFVQPAAPDQRQLNYWLMDKRVVTLPFNLFSTGFALAAYACFFLFSDLGRRQIGFLRTLGQNALAAYILHELVAKAVRAFAPADSPLWWVAATFMLYVGITYLFVRHLEKNGVYLRM
ncbi:MAG TPA: hypothetical protein VGY58_00835 [Gemmataceae bacterium]|jgi:hypothetical protein|nr:hypothetical protein [Gemmataceae bacterium]